MLTPSEPLAHRGDLRADNLPLGGGHQLLALIQRQAERFGDSQIVALDTRHLRLGHDPRLKFSNQLHPPHQLRHGPTPSL
jgi:hypothetical protein